jgi:NAD(P)H-flavin reductase
MPEEVGSEMESGRIRAAVVSGNFLDEHAVKSLKEFVLIDSLPSKTGEAARVVLPSTMLSEVEGTYRNGSGQVKELKSVSLPRGMARPEWMIVRDMAKAMGLEGFDYSSVGEITREISNDPSPKPFSGNPRHNVRELPSRFPGHLTADFVRPLESLGLASTPLEPVGESSEGGFEVLEKSEVVPNMHMLKIRGPEIARFAKPGQFVIVMVKETSERTPFTLVDWSGDSITLVVEEVGRSSREAVALRKGDRIAHVAGPLGVPFPIEQKGTIVLGGGCYGIGAVYPIARAFKEAGSRVICAIEASSKYLLYMEEEIASVCDELRVATKDGSRGIKGGVQEIFADLAGQGVDMFVAVGCTFMMRMASEATKPSGIPTLVALNPIMVDGTGMCGACRVSVDSRTRFACVDGPVFDGHTVDWDELFSRRGAYTREEIEAMPQAPEKQGCGCGRK